MQKNRNGQCRDPFINRPQARGIQELPCDVGKEDDTFETKGFNDSF
jgi:hypothetical protein